MAEYVPIRVSTIRGDQPIEFDTYVKINDKYLLFLRKGDSFEGERLKRLKEKKLQKMYIQPDAEGNYRTYLSRNIDMAYDGSSGKSLEIRSAIVQGDQQSRAESVFENPDDASAYTDAKEAVDKFLGFLEKENVGGAKAILDIENLDGNVAHHGVAVATFSLAIAKRMKMTDPARLKLLTLGALLHDFEHFHSGLSVNRPMGDFNEVELETYKRHPILGAARVQGIKHFEPAVINIITQHEEFIDGRGFPAGLTEFKCDPLSIIVSSANAIDRLITFEGVAKKDAAKQLMMSSVGRHPLKHLQMISDIMQELKYV